MCGCPFREPRVFMGFRDCLCAYHPLYAITIYSLFSIKWRAKELRFEFRNHMEAIAVSPKIVFIVVIVYGFCFILLMISLLRLIRIIAIFDELWHW